LVVVVVVEPPYGDRDGAGDSGRVVACLLAARGGSLGWVLRGAVDVSGHGAGGPRARLAVFASTKCPTAAPSAEVLAGRLPTSTPPPTTTTKRWPHPSRRHARTNGGNFYESTKLINRLQPEFRDVR
jgi:hypothetical protein